MNRNLLSLTISLVTAFLLLLSGTALATEDAVMKDGKKGEIKIHEMVKVGELTLQPGVYVVQHRVEGGEHVMHFSSKDNPELDLTTSVKCELNKKQPRWRSSQVWLTVKDNQKYIEKVMLQGEKITYNFQ